MHDTYLILMKNIIYIDALEFQVAYYFDSVEWFKQDFAKFRTPYTIILILAQFDQTEN